ncbi:MAG: ABC transporter permease subunit [Proteobacteria bacterium]|nr:ABC transporter permease subunit [Pseudomonadota bacterium]
MQWWIRPLVRFIAAILLPFAVPAVITAALWALPGDPAEIICPVETCGQEGQDALAKHWGIDQGATVFYSTWVKKAFTLDFGNSWSTYTGIPVLELLGEALPVTAMLVFLALVPLILGGVLAAMGWLPKRLDPVWQVVGLIPAVIMALVFAAVIQIQYGAESTEWWPTTLSIMLGALVLGVADGALAGSIAGTRSTFEEEVKQRYIQIAILRGETTLSNAVPNVLPALVGQFRGRTLHILSGAVIVEVVLGVPGLGGLLWQGTLDQDFAIVLAAAWAYSILSGAFLLIQALFEIFVALHVHRHPKMVLT